MSVQHIEHSSTAPTQMAMTPTAGEHRTPLPKKLKARADAARAAIARVMLRNSLQMQRQALKKR
ncbi:MULTISPECIES: hypothetical protein [unclassified Bradyrhizobium]|uniref:hypothetical protein n=1 Tax=unclassified Bradyrhizobium TaxID=2631580 RepID=UPI00048C20A3|nr:MULTISPECIES: hypothetical protein [unclassified Bradyrhizobium]QIG97306.1 hypothetical protein G6P99_36260 [Bradyrhizobium sp. 6(2017)]